MRPTLTWLAGGIVVGGLLLAAALAVSGALDPLGLVLLSLIGGLGLLAVAVARRGSRGGVAPAECSNCGGLLSPHSPFCKHCGAPVA